MKRRELFIQALTGAVASLPQVCCRPTNNDYVFSWALEQRHTGYPNQQEGDLDYAVSSLRQMIDQGFHAAFAVSLLGGGLLLLKAWEEPGDELEWPEDEIIVFRCDWIPMRISSGATDEPGSP